MNGSRPHQDLNDADSDDRHARRSVGRTRPLRRSGTSGLVRRESRSAAAASDRIRRHVTERMAHREQAERRRDRVIGHTIVGAVAFVVFVAMLPIIGSLVTFVVATIALFVGLRSLTFAMSIGLDDAWGWTRDGGMSVPIRWSDHVVLSGMAWLRRRSSATIDNPPAGAIQVLPPEPPR
jgi:hypothetical protein